MDRSTEQLNASARDDGTCLTFDGLELIPGCRYFPGVFKGNGELSVHGGFFLFASVMGCFSVCRGDDDFVCRKKVEGKSEVLVPMNDTRCAPVNSQPR